LKRKISKLKKLFSIALVFTLLQGVNAYGSEAVNQVSDYAGNGQNGYTDGAKVEATFNNPYGLAVDSDGGLLVVDSTNNLIRKIKDNTVTTIAGSADKNDVDEFGFPSGGYFDGDALKAKFNHPRGITVDSKGNIFIADTENNVIRKIKDGKVYTFAGSGKSGYKDGANKDAEFNNPSSVIVDKQDNLYVADTSNHVIRKINSNGDVTTYAGSYSEDGGYKDGEILSAQFNEPSAIAFDSKENMFVLDCGNQMIRKISNDFVSTLCGIKTNLIDGTTYYEGDFVDGSKDKAKFNFPKGIFITPNDYIIVADTFNSRIRVVDESGKAVTIAGTGEVGRDSGDVDKASFNQPSGVLYSNGSLYVSDSANNLIRVMTYDFSKLPASIAVNTGNNSDKDKQDNPLDGIKITKTKEVQIWLNKKLIKFAKNKPYINKGNTYVPLRDICEAWGGKVTYDSKTKQIIIKKGSFIKTFSKDNIGGLLVVKNSVNYIYIKQIAEILSLNVDWEAKYNAVILSNRK
jgi:sugar lactone lactonase YvrE